MNGAESLARTLVAGDVQVCFTNPGTSEMHFVAALDRVDGIRCVLCLFEGVATGAADGYARMADKPASTLLHLGPGLSNGLANLHNARRARSPVVNIVGEHATYHRRFDAPLTSDIESLARPVSGWVRTSVDSHAVAADGASAIAAARSAPGQVATLILPADTAWNEGSGIAQTPAAASARRVAATTVEAVAALLRQGGRSMLLLGDKALREAPLALARRIANATGASLLAETSNARMARGAGRVPVERLPYVVDAAVKTLETVETLVLVGARAPVGFFAYPNKPSELAPAGCRIITLAGVDEDQRDALEQLADGLGVRAAPLDLPSRAPAPLPTGALDARALAQVIGALLPEQTIVCDESVTTGRGFFPATAVAPPHDWLQLTGGAIGLGIPLAVGAAVACPDRKVVSLQADGSGMYTVQGLWTQARENLDVLTVIWSNRSYAILRGELAGVGADNPGPKALDMLSLGNPDLDWVSLAKGLGVDGQRVDTAEGFARAFQAGVAHRGPYLIEVEL